ncbi:MAG: polyribonucleotide nucleotidyltransferase [Parcubacteria group bacterium RIFCSPLOWO2_01_FULL_40_65]|nr:MAG: polyribonucleotide nucleotidyltransferase [Parcubacteria group bacterium RIFCSPHIGHO2_01_FULL_40_30]OHB19089.1 MAG: polyribonucleotide nucleotidyltransferase [Parcubacteria group bacterium RIFCSPHIGHO2_02_FULL_40_12]OHB21349.1 MAG: polyribonucleotide nucleotidyltransferase [Parcubacteria group bacterium RIFCSPLOWO2_01_FULL_40_65]OHB23064.1 MAG: polyribonucleotide nucleotidyltransferase [Parcubacteria group bacterium RIFCSPLOWO2_02_FULL_40_12]
MAEIKKFSTEYGGRELEIEIGKLAGQADGAIFIKYGDTSVLVTAVMSDFPRNVNYMPLTVDYEERYYAAGKIKGSRWIKRETRPGEEAILHARVIDRTLRPRFDQRIRNDIQIVATILSFDNENDPDIPALIGASLALMISDIPFNGPVAGVRIGEIDGKLVLNPNYEERKKSSFDLVVAGIDEKVNMLEFQGEQIPEDKVLKAIEFGHKEYRKIIEFQNSIAKELKPKKRNIEIFEPDPKILEEIKNFLGNKLESILYESDGKAEARDKLIILKESLANFLKENHSGHPHLDKILSETENIFGRELDEIVRKNILEKEKRSDGRKLDQLRPLSIEVGVLPRTHGSGIFQRGETQVLNILTLGSPGKEQWIEEMETEKKKYFMHHYNFPPYSSGETGRIGFPGRREIGHGALAEKSLEPVIPTKENFPYTIRLVSETLSSNGSTSMASVCASTLALMDGGVPIKELVAGISIGLALSPDGKKFKLLTDIQGEEDHHGDMDFKVAGTKNGITGIQLDVKTEGLTKEIIEEALEQAKKTRLKILEEMKKVITSPRAELSPFAPRVYKIQINPEKIRNVIGPGGKIINEIVAQTGVNIDIEDSGLVFVTSEKEEGAKKALEWINNLTREVKAGEIFEGVVVKIMDFGAFVELFPKQDGLVHISEISDKRIDKISDIMKVGDMVKVKVKKIDDQGRVSLTMKF